MSDDPILRIRSRAMSNSGRALRLPLVILSAGIWVLALSEIGQGWEMVRLASSYEVPARIGDLVSATLVNGQVFFGTLETTSRTTIRLHDVFFAQLPQQSARGADPDADLRAPTILRRLDNEWTQADSMAIPVERIAFMETVGVDSRMARFIADARSRPAALPVEPPPGPGGGVNNRQPPPPPPTPPAAPAPKG
jgi:hypothetical protein